MIEHILIIEARIFLLKIFEKKKATHKTSFSLVILMLILAEADEFNEGLWSHREHQIQMFCKLAVFNPYLTNGFSHHYQLGESTFIFRGVRSDF